MERSNINNEFICASVQISSTESVTDNLKVCESLIKEAHKANAQLIVLPETFSAIGKHDKKQIEIAEPIGQGPIQDFVSNICQKLNVWIVAGTIPIITDENKLPTSASILFDNNGNQCAVYNKIHLFDVEVNDESYKESEIFTAGNTPVVVDTPFIKLGLAVCYDLRFPELFRLMVEKGAEMVTLPSAFTQTTGEAHWDTLLRARAIENQIWMVGSGQYGMHPNNKKTYGHSMIVDPWGTIVSSEEKPINAICIAKIKKSEQTEIRNKLPSLKHRIF